MCFHGIGPVHLKTKAFLSFTEAVLKASTMYPSRICHQIFRKGGGAMEISINVFIFTNENINFILTSISQCKQQRNL